MEVFFADIVQKSKATGRVIFICEPGKPCSFREISKEKSDERFETAFVTRYYGAPPQVFPGSKVVFI